eukprot:8299721-Ditylum_brightwellii.AAC.1
MDDVSKKHKNEEKKATKGERTDNNHDWYESSNEELDGDKEEEEYEDYDNDRMQTEVIDENAQYIHELSQ